jgi:GDP-4-dehydro-6-deoxy-D-mannose reductase
LQPVILVASSSAVYGKPESHPMTEDHAFAPLTDYGVSKVAQEMVARSYSLSRGTRVIVARAFNLIGPRQSEKLAASEFARQIALVERGTPGPVRVGNLTPRRDYTDIRDAVAAYSLLAGIDDPADVYNVCSNVSRPLQEALDILIRAARVPIDVLPDPHRSKETEIEDQVGCFDRLRKATGWQPKISFEQSLLDLLDDWRARVAADCPQ